METFSPPRVTQVLALGCLLGAVLAVARWRAPVPLRAVTLVGAAFLVATPVQPWYALLLVVLAVLAARPEWLLVAAAAYPAYFSAVLRDPRFVGIGALSYGLAAAGVLLVTLLRARRPVVTGATPPQPVSPLSTKSPVSVAAQSMAAQQDS